MKSNRNRPGESEVSALRGVPRREFLAGLAALGASALLPHAVTMAGTQSANPARPWRIDTHHHVASPGFIAEISARKTGQRPLIEWTPAKSIEEMDKASVATAILSTSEPGVWFGDDDAAAKLARECNEYTARVMADHPGRFGMFAIVPLPYVDGALREIEYSLDTLKADGICMMTDYQGKFLGDPKFAPVMDELNRRKAILYFHPFRAECCKNLQPELGPATIELGTDTTRNIASLIFSGTTVRCPDIRLIFSHGGGTFPYLMNRMVTVAQRPDIKAKLPKGLLYEVQKLYYDTAMFFNPYSTETFRKLVPTSHILYGTDYPFVTPATVANGLASCGYSPGELRAVERENALALFPRLKKT
jgi:6-methylsalicylate decarboxylase